MSPRIKFFIFPIVKNLQKIAKIRLANFGWIELFFENFFRIPLLELYDIESGLIQDSF